MATSSNNASSQQTPSVAVVEPPRELDHNQIIQQILGRVLGLNGALPIQEEEPGIAIIHSTQGNTRRPVGLLIRHGTVGNDAMNSNGLFGLLNSISNIRQSHNPDALSNAQFEQFLHHILMNESSHAGAPPASESVLQNLPKVTISETTDLTTLGECCISQEPFENGDVVICLPCGHNYKEEPIVHWLKMHNTCPVCRIEITSISTTEN